MIGTLGGMKLNMKKNNNEKQIKTDNKEKKQDKKTYKYQY